MSPTLAPIVVIVSMLAVVAMSQLEAEKRFYSWEAGAAPSKRGVYSWAGKRSAPMEDDARAKRFYSWDGGVAGKRGKEDQKRKFYSWADPTAEMAEKRKFYSWAG